MFGRKAKIKSLETFDREAKSCTGSKPEALCSKTRLVRRQKRRNRDLAESIFMYMGQDVLQLSTRVLKLARADAGSKRSRQEAA